MTDERLSMLLRFSLTFAILIAICGMGILLMKDPQATQNDREVFSDILSILGTLGGASVVSHRSHTVAKPDGNGEEKAE